MRLRADESAGYSDGAREMEHDVTEGGMGRVNWEGWENDSEKTDDWGLVRDSSDVEEAEAKMD